METDPRIPEAASRAVKGMSCAMANMVCVCVSKGERKFEGDKTMTESTRVTLMARWRVRALQIFIDLVSSASCVICSASHLSGLYQNGHGTFACHLRCAFDH